MEGIVSLNLLGSQLDIVIDKHNVVEAKKMLKHEWALLNVVDATIIVAVVVLHDKFAVILAHIEPLVFSILISKKEYLTLETCKYRGL